MSITGSLLNRSLFEAFDILRNRVAVPYGQYATLVATLGRPVVNCLDLSQMNPEEIENVSRLVYAGHCLYTRFNLVSGTKFVIGYPSSLDFKARYPGEYLASDLLKVTETYLDKGYKLSLNQNEARERMQNFLSAESTQYFLAGEITGAQAYYILVALAIACQAIFKSNVYQTCFEAILQDLQRRNFGNGWQQEDTKNLVKTTAYLVSGVGSQKIYTETLNQYFELTEVNRGYDAAQVCYSLFISLLEEENHE